MLELSASGKYENSSIKIFPKYCDSPAYVADVAHLAVSDNLT